MKQAGTLFILRQNYKKKSILAINNEEFDKHVAKNLLNLSSKS